MRHLGILLALIASIGSITAQESPELQLQPSGDIVERGLNSLAMLTCSVSGRNIEPNLKWFKGPKESSQKQQITDRSGRLYIEYVGKQELKLYITSIKNEDSGRYTCEGVINGATMSKDIELMLFKDITFDDAPTPQHPTIYQDELIVCRVSGQPIPQVSWKYKGEVLQTNAKYAIEENGLRIRNITLEDNGDYQCRAEVQSDGRLDMRTINVDVHIPPKLLASPGTVEGIEKTEVSFSCKASGHPSPKWEFFKDGNKQPLSSTATRIVDAQAGVIHFRPVSRNDDGEYKCVAINEAGEDSATGDLYVIVPPLILEYKEVTGEENKGTTLECKTEGNPAPSMVFRKVTNDYDYVLGDNENGRVVVRQVDQLRATLTISSLQPTDTANYTCTAANTGGKNALNSTITVHYRPRFPEDHEVDVYSWAGKTRNMTCHAIAEPEPLIEWKLFGRVLENNETYRIYPMGRNSALQITVREEDQGWIFSEYTCSAKNAYGTGTQEMMLHRATVPDKPKEVTVKDDSPTMVILTVVPSDDDGGVPIYAYRVEYDTLVQEFKLTPREELRIENLRPSTTYIFRVRAKNEVGVGNALELSHSTEKIRSPYPLVITSDPIGLYPYEYTVNWEKPKTGGLAIIEYRVKYREVKVTEDGAIAEPLGSYITSYVTDNPNAPLLYYRLEGLKPDRHYQIEMEARNEVGWGLANEDFAFKTAEEDEAAASHKKASMGTAAVIAIVVAVFFVFLVIVDISCFFINDCGVLMCICVNFCGKRDGPAKEKQMEEGERLMGKPSPNISKEAHPAPIEEARVAPEMHATPPLHQVQEENEEDAGAGPEDTQDAVDGGGRKEENLSRRSRPISHLSDNERWNDVVNEFKREISSGNRMSRADDDDEEEDEDKDDEGPNENDYEKEDLKEESNEDADEKTPLQVNEYEPEDKPSETEIDNKSKVIEDNSATA